MKDNKIAVHTNAVNLARRWSIQNENDLMQEDFFAEPENKQYTKDECQKLASHMIHPNAIPDQCKKYQDVMQVLKRNDTDTAHPTAWMS